MLLNLKLEGALALTLARNSKILHLFLEDSLCLIFQSLLDVEATSNGGDSRFARNTGKEDNQ